MTDEKTQTVVKHQQYCFYLLFTHCALKGQTQQSSSTRDVLQRFGQILWRKLREVQAHFKVSQYSKVSIVILYAPLLPPYFWFNVGHFRQTQSLL